MKTPVALAQAQEIDAILVTELTRWGRSTIDLMQTIQDLRVWNVSVIAQTGFQFDMETAQGKLLASLMASLAEFERDLLKERVRSGLAAAKARGKLLVRQIGDRPKSDKLAPKVIELFNACNSYRKIASICQLSTNTVMGILRRNELVSNMKPA